MRTPMANLLAAAAWLGLSHPRLTPSALRDRLLGTSPRRIRPVRLGDLPVKALALESLVIEPLSPREHENLVEIVIQLDASRAELGRYLYSKLYYCFAPGEAFSEERVVCFEVPQRDREERLQIALPPAAWMRALQTKCLRFRIDGIPYTSGAWQLKAVRLVDGHRDPELARRAYRVAHRQWIREEVRTSERGRRVDLPHYPESVSLELTPVCNLRCPHCSSHGIPHLHKHHNRQPEMPLERLHSIAEETFPHASVVSLVGRGEPTLVSDELWGEMTSMLRKHDLRMSCVTNGTRVRQRFDEALMPYVHELIFSMDGMVPATFEANRLGARHDVVVDNLRYYHELRNRVPLARRPQLTISWTLKHNNIRELPDFIRWVAQFEPDLISLRHLVVFQDKERQESLLEHPVETNLFLLEAYAEMDQRGLRHESPPLMMEGGTAVVPPPASTRRPVDAPSQHKGALPPPPPERTERALAPEPVAAREPECNWMHRTAIIMADGEVITCGKHYAEQIGHLDESTSVLDLWNGPKMKSLRKGFGGAGMWDQCKDCWLRELKWHSQRNAKDLSRPFDLNAEMDYSNAAWDYRRYSEL